MTEAERERIGPLPPGTAGAAAAAMALARRACAPGLDKTRG